MMTQIPARDTVDADTSALVEAIHWAQAVIEFEPDGTILTANENFLDTMGYTLLDAMLRFAEGDLTVHVDANEEGEIGRLYRGFNDAGSTM